MENNNNKSGNNFFSGFLLGVLVGACAVFLLGTKKGKKILKAISEEGEGKISNILDKLDKSIELPEETLGDEPSFTEVSEEQGKNLLHRKVTLNKEIEEKPKVRRFFRGISRRLN